MNGIFASTGQALCNGYASVANQAPDACFTTDGLTWIGGIAIGLSVIAVIVISWRVFL